jgi:hypothetical protein
MHRGRPRRGCDLPDKLADQVVGWTRKAHPDSVNSLHADFVAGRRWSSTRATA